jgi:carbon monoxide dehydrogenase subunit G
MNFENRAVVPSRHDHLWDLLMDIPRVAICIPGVEDVQELDADQYTGTMGLKVGPIKLRFRGRIRITERDFVNNRATMLAEGADQEASGWIKATISLSLKQSASGQTEMIVGTEATVMGRLGEFGQPIMKKKAQAIMTEFVKNLAGVLQPPGDGGA